MNHNNFISHFARLSFLSFVILSCLSFFVFQSIISNSEIISHQNVKINSFAQLPVRFEKNMGQINSDADFLFQSQALTLSLKPNKSTISLRQAKKSSSDNHKTKPPTVTMSLNNANPNAIGEGLDKLITKSNYFIGNDSTNWRKNIPNYAKVQFSEIYPGIDLVYYGKNGKLEYDFKVSPGVNPSVIALQFEKEADAKLNENGDLILKVGNSSVTMLSPIAYQEIDGDKKFVEASYSHSSESSFGFEVEDYDECLPLVIDPVLVFSTYITDITGGCEDITTDSEGNIYIVGGSWRVFITKLAPDGSSEIFTTYLKGDLADFGKAIAVDNNGYIYITGETQSDNFPIQNALQEDFGGTLWVDGDAFVTKLDPDGSTIVYSTYLGGYSGDIGRDITVDLEGNAYITGSTWGGGFPVYNALQPNHSEVEDVFVSKIAPDGSSFIFSTFLGGSNSYGLGRDEGHGIAIDATNNIYITGSTISDNFPTVNAYQEANIRGSAFVTKMNTTGTSIIYSTYFGAPYNSDIGGREIGKSIAVDNVGHAYVTGSTNSPDFPIKPQNVIQPSYGGGTDGFVTKFAPDGQSLIFSTYLGGTDYDYDFSIALDSEGNAYVTGHTLSVNFPIKNSIQSVLKGSSDALVTGISSNGLDLLFSSYLGGSGFDEGSGIAVDNNGHIFITGQTNSGDFPIISPLSGSSGSGFVTEIDLENDQIIWKNITANYSVPGGINVYEGKRKSPKLVLYYIDADLNLPELSVRPYLRGDRKTVKNFNNIVGAYASINGGFFDGKNTNVYSAVIYPEDLKVKNTPKVTRNSKAYPVTRGLFSMKSDKSFSVDWVYHFGQNYYDIFTYGAPLPYIYNDPQPKDEPEPSNGTVYGDLLTGIGGGPVLIKNNKIKISYNEEILWGSGVGKENRDPRSAVGYTADKHIIMLVADGRSEISLGVGLTELAQIMYDLGCVEALNLDGGGSSQLAIGNSFVNNPSEQRILPSILSIVNINSVNPNESPRFNYIVDTEGDKIQKVGSWTESFNPGAYGSSNSLFIPSGEGNNHITYNLEVDLENDYELYAWWIADTQNSKDTPYIINHKNGIDTVTVDQTESGSFWNIIGNFTFTGTNTDYVKITDGGTTGGYISADAIRIVSEEKITGISEQQITLPNVFRLKQNYPNPFNPSTTIKYSLPTQSNVTLKVFDVLGSEITTLINKEQPLGNYEIEFDGNDLTSGIYFYRLQAGDFVETKKMILMK